MQTIYYIDRYGNIDRTGFRYKKTPTVKIYPVTLVNLVGGIASSFEYDSDGDGLADGWTKTAGGKGTTSLVSGVVGTQAQQIEYDNSAGSGIAWTVLWRDIPQKSNNAVVFLSAYLFKTADYCTVTLYYYPDGVRTAIGSVSASSTEQWERSYKTITLPSDVESYTLRVEIIHGVNAGNAGLNKYDGIALYNLTNMGVLPLPLQELYGAETWAELDADTLAQLLPYTNSVTSLGFAWESDV